VRQVLSDQSENEYRGEGVRVKRVDKKPSLSIALWQNGARTVSYFLPKGYPDSVAPGYDSFVKGQMVAMVLSTAGGVLSMQSLLFALGLGAGSLPLAATLNWIVKDGLGQLGGVIFAGMVNNQFDADPKRWRMIAAVSLDASSFVELLTPLAPGYFLPLAAVANVGKNVSFLAASASRAAIHKSFATHENLADVTAKTGSQCILSSLVGTSLGLSLAASLGGDYLSIVAAFVACSALNLAATAASLKGVTLTTLSSARLDFVINAFMDARCRGAPLAASDEGGEGTAHAVILSPRQVMESEKWLGAPGVGAVPVTVGADLDEVVTSAQELSSLLDLYSDRPFLASVRETRPSTVEGEEEGERKGEGEKEREAEVHLLFKEGADKGQVLQGLVHALLLRRMLRAEGITKCPSPLSPFSLTKVRTRTKNRSAQENSNNSSTSSSTSSSNGSGSGKSVWRRDLLSRALEPQQQQLVDEAVGALQASSALSGGWLVEELMLESRVARVRAVPLRP
jgi:hypothetical protein